MSKKILVVEADENDADYVTKSTRVTDKDLVKLIPIFNKMKNFKGISHWTDHWRDKYPNLLEEELDIVDEYVPGGIEQSCHTIHSIKLIEIIKEKTYL